MQAQDVIDRQVTQMARLIDDLLDLSRINRGLVQLQLERVSIAPLVQSALEVARPAIERPGTSCRCSCRPSDLVIDADPTRIVQVIGNLLGNAAKYTPDGGNIRLAVWRAGHKLVLEVADNGIGIPPEQQGRLFQMFTQLHHSTTRAKGGLGIGLSLVKNLVQMHGGTCRWRAPASTRAAPSRCGCRWSTSRSRSSRRRPPPRTPGSPPARACWWWKTTTTAARCWWRCWRCSATGTASPPTASTRWRLAERFAPDIVLLDLGLPFMDGLEVCRRLRDTRHGRHAVIVALTGWGAESRSAADGRGRLRRAPDQAGRDVVAGKSVRGRDDAARALRSVSGSRARPWQGPSRAPAMPGCCAALALLFTRRHAQALGQRLFECLHLRVDRRPHLGDELLGQGFLHLAAELLEFRIHGRLDDADDLAQLILGKLFFHHRTDGGGRQPDGPRLDQRDGFVEVLLDVRLDLLGDRFALVGRNAARQHGAGTVHQVDGGLFRQATRHRLDAGLLQLEDAGDQVFLAARRSGRAIRCLLSHHGCCQHGGQHGSEEGGDFLRHEQ